MKLTRAQVAEILDVGQATVTRLVSEGHLKPVNGPTPGATKFFAKFEEQEIRDFAAGPWQDIKATRSQIKSAQHREDVTATLKRIEGKLDKLLEAL